MREYLEEQNPFLVRLKNNAITYVLNMNGALTSSILMMVEVNVSLLDLDVNWKHQVNGIIMPLLISEIIIKHILQEEGVI